MSRGSRSAFLRSYGPLPGLALATLLVVLVLPSALTLPPNNPTTTPEFAPVPPQDADKPPQLSGNLSAVGLGSSAGIGAGTGAGDTPALPPAQTGLAAAGKNPRTKLCVGSPPRQTADKLSPPCVAYFNGDNGGATHQGVTKDEIRVLVYFDGGQDASSQENGTSRGSEQIPSDKYYDLNQPASSDEFIYARVLRVYQRFFNTRYQLYNRNVHMVVHFGRPDDSPESRRADAAQDLQRFHPFAALNFAGANGTAYTTAMAQHGVLTVLGKAGGLGVLGFTEAFFNRFPGLLLSYLPSIDQRARLFTRYFCAKVQGRPVSFSGNPDDSGQRKVGMVISNDASGPELVAFGQLIRRDIERCGAKPYVVATKGSDKATQSVQDMAAFSQAGITTVVWAAGESTEYTTAAGNLHYLPEWLIPGDLSDDTNLAARLNDQQVMAQARTVTTYTRVDAVEGQPCFDAAREADPSIPRTDAIAGCLQYPTVLELYNALQVAGPKLTPTTIDQGIHAIPPYSSNDPTTPACFYEARDYTCVKDEQVTWWDPQGAVPGSSARGCWRMQEGGRRYLSDSWPAGEGEKQRDRARDRCNIQGPELA